MVYYEKSFRVVVIVVVIIVSVVVVIVVSRSPTIVACTTKLAP